MRFSWVAAWLVCALAGLPSATLVAADQKAEFDKAKRAVQQQLRSRQPADRVAALAKLQTIPIADSARLIEKSLEDEDEEVRQSAYQALLSLNDSQEVCQTLLQTVKRALQQRTEGVNVAPHLAVLLTSKLPAIERETNALLAKAAGRNSEQVILSLTDMLGASGERLNVVPLAGISRSKAFDESFAVRRAVVDALTRIHAPEAIGALIELLGRVQGEAGADAVEHLSYVTEQVYGFEAEAWQKWWETAKSKFEYPQRRVAAPYRDGSVEAPGQYYGLPIFASRMVFVIDTSGSMSGRKILLAKRELIRAINGLQPDAWFSIVVFNTYVDVWQSKLVKATDQAKKAATLYVEAQVAHANTASYDALEAGFRFDTEAIYFLSDGAPNGGKIGAPADIVAAISEANTARRISLYAIGIEAGFPGSVLDQFLGALAKQNYGVYRRVDE